MMFVTLLQLLAGVNWGFCQTPTCEEHCEPVNQILAPETITSGNPAKLSSNQSILEPTTMTSGSSSELHRNQSILEAITMTDSSSVELNSNQSTTMFNNTDRLDLNITSTEMPATWVPISRDAKEWNTYRPLGKDGARTSANKSSRWNEFPTRVRSAFETEGGVEQVNEYKTLDYNTGEPITVINMYLPVRQKTVLGTFPIDEVLGRDSRIWFSATTLIVRVSIVGKNLSVNSLSPTTPTFYVTCTNTTCDFRIKYMAPASYSYAIKLSSDDEFVEVMVQSRAVSSSPIFVKCNILEILKTTRNNTVLMPIYTLLGEMTGTPIMNATVFALAKAPKGNTVILRLRDNGIHPDVKKGDGIYSGHFTKFSGSGLYQFSVLMDEVAEATRWEEKTVETIVDPDSADPSYLLWHKNLRFTGPLMRYNPCKTSISNGGINIAIQEGLGNMYPPSPIMDLEIIGVNMKLEKFTMKFTAAGSSLSSGTADKYICAYSKDHEYLRKHFDKCPKIPDVEYEIPHPVFTVTVIHVKFYGIWTSHFWFVALKACNIEGICSEVSNVVRIPMDSPPSPFMPLGPILMPNELFVPDEDPLDLMDLLWPEKAPDNYVSAYGEDVVVTVTTEDYFDSISDGASAVSWNMITVVLCLMLYWIGSILLTLPYVT